MSPLCSLPAQKTLGWPPKLVKKQQLVTRHRSVNVFEKCSVPGAATICALHITQTITSQQFNRWAFVYFFLSCRFRHRSHDNVMNDSLAQGSVSVNVPQFLAPPVEGMSQVSVMNLSSAEAGVSHPHEKNRTISLPDVSRESLCPLV